MIIPATVDFLAPKFRAGLITAIYTPTDATEMARLAEQHQAERGQAVDR